MFGVVIGTHGGEASPRHSRARKECSRGVSSRGGREEVYVFVNAIVARSRFFFFFRSRERGEIKSDCNH